MLTDRIGRTGASPEEFGRALVGFTNAARRLLIFAVFGEAEAQRRLPHPLGFEVDVGSPYLAALKGVSALFFSDCLTLFPASPYSVSVTLSYMQLVVDWKGRMNS